MNVIDYKIISRPNLFEYIKPILLLIFRIYIFISVYLFSYTLFYKFSKYLYSLTHIIHIKNIAIFTYDYNFYIISFIYINILPLLIWGNKLIIFNSNNKIEAISFNCSKLKFTPLTLIGDYGRIEFKNNSITLLGKYVILELPFDKIINVKNNIFITKIICLDKLKIYIININCINIIQLYRKNKSLYNTIKNHLNIES